ncbi:ABC-type lipoprotein export system ATPase subunit [Propionicimonas paludicola]|uniref:ABC-type lipoprotein export system ATPase subunit n=1 Tax=Propionicimonas paludicola TaxID=185243 RepID=A0A2A9CM43_9ACTN|nr:ATP-binding cassette domain-containing protein [Propionicimonas paludicola]PFG15527.1 ABC-type lipoprotein export system ATPase subunit [Propionicimonas paludicola]
MSEPATSLAATAHAAADDHLIVCESVVRIFQHGPIEVQALQGLDLHVTKGEMIAVVGPSGAGKSTLLSILAGADSPTAGTVRVAGWDLAKLPANQRVGYRRGVVGLVQQQTSRNLIPYLNAVDNVVVPLSLSSYPRRKRAARAAELLDRFGVGYCARRLPGEMSGGEQQRVAIAVAMANEPPLLLADEPTGELDTTTSHEIFETLRATSAEDGVTVVVVTHDPTVSGQVGRTVAIRDGRTSSEVLRHTEELEDGQQRIVAQEYAVMDRAGRVQVPREFREALELTRRVRLTLEANHLELWPDDRR